MQNKNMPAEGKDSAKLEAESALRGAACCASSIPFGTDLTHVAEENSKAVDELLATGQFLVDVGHDLIPSEGLEEGCPVRRANESVGGTRTPNGNDCPSKTRAMCAPLQGGDGVVLVGGGLRSEGLCEGNDDQGNSLLLEVGDFEFIHGGVGESSFLHNV
jgi:hypothetical protein